MFYALTPPQMKAERLRLYPTLAAAVARGGEDSPIYAVAVEFDRCGRLVVPRWVIPQAVDAGWTTPAVLHGDGSLTAQGTIPGEFFVGRVNTPIRSYEREDIRIRWRWRGCPHESQ